MTATERARRSDSLYYGNSPKRYLCDRIANIESDLEDAESKNAKLQEQMERLVTLLRVDCDIEASWDGLRRFWNIGLTENGCLMRDRACKAEAENARLRERITTQKQTIQAYRDESREWREVAERAQAENAKLKQELEAVGTAAYLYGRNDLADENAKLRTQLVDVTESMGRVEGRCAKLRELAVRMFHTIEWSDRMSDSMYWPSFSYERELRELGVEVDE